MASSGAWSSLLAIRATCWASRLDCLFRQIGTRRQPVDAFRQPVQSRDHFAGRAILDQFLDLARQRRDARLDPLKGLRVETRLLHGRCRSDDGPRNLVQPLLDLCHRLGAAPILARKLVDGGGQSAHLLLERSQRQRFRQVADRLADMFQAAVQGGDLGVIGRQGRLFEIRSSKLVQRLSKSSQRRSTERTVSSRARFSSDPFTCSTSRRSMLMPRSSLRSESPWMASESRSNSAVRTAPSLPEPGCSKALDDVLAQALELAPQPRRHLMPSSSRSSCNSSAIFPRAAIRARDRARASFVGKRA